MEEHLSLCKVLNQGTVSYGNAVSYINNIAINQVHMCTHTIQTFMFIYPLPMFI